MSDEVIASEATEAAAPVKFFVMTIGSVTFDLVNATPEVHLTEDDYPFRTLSIPIALPEAQALENALKKNQGRRPSTHELFTDVLGQVNIDVIAARIVKLENGVFYSELDLMSPKGRIVLDCRTSDALIMASRQAVPAPILCAESVLKQFYV
jgi:bifunctional DNase/RNase